MWNAFPKIFIQNLKNPLFKRVRRKLGTKMYFDVEVNRIVWVDLEMTGLDIDNDTIMEVACVITDSNLNLVAEGPNLIIKTPEDKLNAMVEWCRETHGKNGLTEAAKRSTITMQNAEDQIMNFVEKHVLKKHCPLAGNSIYVDRLFIRKYMPRLDDYLHYRIIDVSTVKELCRRWNNSLYKSLPKKEYTHRAKDDILESIMELKYFRDTFFITSCVTE